MRWKFLLILVFTLNLQKTGAQCTGAIQSFPYTEDFETSNGGWTPGGTASDWSWGVPTKPVINTASGGGKCWVTGTLTQSSYSNNQNSTLTSPCFNFTSLTAPYIRFKIFWEIEKKYDGASFQYSTDGGNNWTTLGSYASGQSCPGDNWYNTSGITTLGSDGWSGNIQPTSPCAGGAGNGSGQWKIAQQDISMLAGQSNVRFRFRFAAGSVCNNYDGFAVDEIWIGNAPVLSPEFSFTCTTANTVSFQPIGSTCNPQYYWDFGDPASGADNNSTLSNPTHTYSSPGNYTVSLSFLSAPNPIPGTKTVTITDVTTQVLTPINCQGDKASLAVSVQPAGNYSYIWNTTPPQTTPVLNGLNAGNYMVTVSGENVCTNSDNITIPPPTALTVSLGNDTIACNGSSMVLDAGFFSGYEWQDGSQGKTFVATSTGVYWVKVFDNSGCTASDTIRVTLDCSDIYFPSAFTPDGDGLNDRFGAIGNVSGVKDFQLQIFNRWGDRIYQSGNPLQKWDGTVKGKSSGAQTFVWLATYKLISTGQSIQQKGTITLIK